MSSMCEKLPPCVGAREDLIEGLCKVADAVAANCSATNGQVLDAMCVLLGAFSECSKRNDAIMVKVADAIADVRISVGEE